MYSKRKNTLYKVYVYPHKRQKKKKKKKASNEVYIKITSKQNIIRGKRSFPRYIAFGISRKEKEKIATSITAPVLLNQNPAQNSMYNKFSKIHATYPYNANHKENIRPFFLCFL